MNREKKLRRQQLYQTCVRSDPRVEQGRKVTLLFMVAWAVMRVACFALSLAYGLRSGQDSWQMMLHGMTMLVMLLFAWYLYRGIGRWYVLVPAIVGVINLFQVFSSAEWKKAAEAGETLYLVTCGYLVFTDVMQIAIMLVLLFFTPYIRYCAALRAVDRKMLSSSAEKANRPPEQEN